MPLATVVHQGPLVMLDLRAHKASRDPQAPTVHLVRRDQTVSMAFQGQR